MAGCGFGGCLSGCRRPPRPFSPCRTRAAPTAFGPPGPLSGCPGWSRAASVALGLSGLVICRASACFRKNVGHLSRECMQVEGPSWGRMECASRLPGMLRRPPAASCCGRLFSARTRWLFDQHFLQITHWTHFWPPAAPPAARPNLTARRPAWRLALPARPPSSVRLPLAPPTSCPNRGGAARSPSRPTRWSIIKGKPAFRAVSAGRVCPSRHRPPGGFEVP